MRFSGYEPCMISGGDSERDPPVPIPNTEVKPFSADGTWLETARESRTLPDSTRNLAIAGFFFYVLDNAKQPETGIGSQAVCGTFGHSAEQRHQLFV